MHGFRNFVFLIGRILISVVFIYDAAVLVRQPDNAAALIARIGLPSEFVMVIALCQVIGGLMIIFGFWTRLAAVCFAAFCVATAALFHHDVTSTSETIQAGKDLGLAAGFLFLAASGPGGWSLTRQERREE